LDAIGFDLIGLETLGLNPTRVYLKNKDIALLNSAIRVGWKDVLLSDNAII